MALFRPTASDDSSQVATLGPLEGEVMVFQPMLIKEISIGGALVETRFPLHLNSLHDLRLELGPRSVVVKGRVVHSQTTGVEEGVEVYWTGIEFVEPSAHAAAAITEFFGSLSAGRR